MKYIPGLRQPSREEENWVRTQWLPILEKSFRPTGGILPLGIAIFFLAFAILSLLLGPSGIGGAFVLLLVAAGFFGFYCLNKHYNKVSASRIETIKRGDFQVASAIAIRVYSGSRPGTLSYMAKVVLPNGTPLSDLYPIPSQYGYPMTQQKLRNVPVLLVWSGNSSQVLAIPKQQINVNLAKEPSYIREIRK